MSSISEGTGRHQNMVYRREPLIKRLEKLKEYRHDLKELKDLSFDDYIKDRRTRYAIERLLFLVSEDILDFLEHILSSRYEVLSNSYEEIIDNAYEKGLLEKDLYPKLKGLGGFRNILAHEYLNISHEEVFKNFKKFLSIIDTVIERFESLL